jgi:hypothetical protein
VRVTSLSHNLDLLAGSGEGRSTGIHASDIYTSLYQQLEPTRYVKGSKPDDLRMAMGLAWEQYLEALLVRNGVKVFRPGELLTDEGVAYSPDGLLENRITRLIEYKCTWMSSREDITHPKFGKWITQVQFYLHALQLRHARFYVLYVNGDYTRGAGGPVLKMWDIEFADQELQETHQMLMNHAADEGLI